MHSEDATNNEHIAWPNFFLVSLRKLLLMQIATFGVYTFYWFYRNWVAIRQYEKVKISPFLRSIFTPLFIYSCFYRIQNSPQPTLIQPRYPAGWLAFLWIILKAHDGGTIGFFSQFGFLLLLPTQSYVNAVAIQTRSRDQIDDRFTLWNLILITLTSAYYLQLLWYEWAKISG